MIIPSVKEEDAGAYICKATTEMGEVSEVTTVLVVTGLRVSWIPRTIRRPVYYSCVDIVNRT